MSVNLQIVTIAISVLTTLGNTVVAVDTDQRMPTPSATEASSAFHFLEDLGDALFEAGCSFAALVVAALLITSMKERGRQKVLARAAASKARDISLGRAPRSGAGLIPDAKERSISPRAAMESCRGTREGVLAAPSAQRISAPDGHALVAAVRAKRAGELPMMLEAFRQRVAARGANAAAVREAAALNLVSALRACATNRCFREALAAYDHEANHIGAGCTTLWSLLLYCAVEAREFCRCAAFFEDLCTIGTPSGNDLVNMVRYYVQVGDETGFRELIKTTSGETLDTISRNRALMVCTSNHALGMAEILACDGATGVPMDAVAYNTLIKGYALAKNHVRCSEVYARMKSACIEPSEVTFGILLDAFIECQELDRARAIFSDLRSSGLRANVVHYTVFIKGLANAGQLEDATAVLDEMIRGRETKPDLITYSTLVRAYADHGKMLEAIGVLERMLKQGIVPDEIIFNIVLTGSTVRATEPSEIFPVLNRLANLGLKASTSTISILLKALAKSSAWDSAFELLETAPERLGIVPEFRLYIQLAQACASAGEGRRVVDAYSALLRASVFRGTPIDYSTNARLWRLASSCGQTSAASRIHHAVKQGGGLLSAAEVAELVAGLP